MNIRFAWALFAVFITSGCAFTPERPVPIQPDVRVSASSMGKGSLVSVVVADERPSTTLGTRGVKGVGAEITVTEMSVPIRNALVQGLEQQGFTIAKSPTEIDRALKVEIRNLDYGVTRGFWAGSLKTQCALKAICIVGKDRPYENLYRGEFSDSVQVVQSEEKNERFVNTAVSDAVNRLLSDEALMKCLTTPK